MKNSIFILLLSLLFIPQLSFAQGMFTLIPERIDDILSIALGIVGLVIIIAIIIAIFNLSIADNEPDRVKATKTLIMSMVIFIVLIIIDKLLDWTRMIGYL